MVFRLSLVLSLALGLVGAACSLDLRDPDPDGGGPNGPGDSSGGGDLNVPDGVAITSFFSEVGVGESLRFEVAVEGGFQASREVKWSSSDEDVLTVDSEGVVTGVALGQATVTVASAVKDSVKDSVEVEVVPCHQPVAVSRTITENQTWSIHGEEECVHYLLTAAVSLQAELAVEEGVRVAAVHNAGIDVRNKGQIQLKGSADKPVVFTAQNPEEGWRGIRIQTQRNNVIEHAELGFCGAGDLWNSNAQARACVHLGQGQVAIRHTTIHDSPNYGVYVTHHDGSLEGFSTNRFYGNRVSMRILPNQVAELDGETDFNSDEDNPNALVGVEVSGGTVGRVPGSGEKAVWSALLHGHPYRVLTPVTTDVRLEIEPGAHFVFEEHSGIMVSSKGSLRAVGDEVARIVFRGKEERAGFWRGLKFSSESLHNELEHVVVANAGSQEWNVNDNAVASVFVRNGWLKMRRSLVRDGGSYGLALQRTLERLVEFSANEFAGNKAPARIHATQIEQLDSETKWEADPENLHSLPGVEVRGATVNRGGGNEEVVWPALADGHPYVITGDTIIEARVKIEPGSVLNLQENVTLNVGTNGSLKAVGNADKRIVFQGGEDLLGYWTAIRYTTKSQHNEISYATFENGAGANVYRPNDDGQGFIYTVNGGVKVSHSTFGELPAGTRVKGSWSINCYGPSNEIELGAGNEFFDGKGKRPEC